MATFWTDDISTEIYVIGKNTGQSRENSLARVRIAHSKALYWEWVCHVWGKERIECLEHSRVE